MTARKKTGIDKVLAERGKVYGDYPTRAGLCQDIKRAMNSTNMLHTLPDTHVQALEMIADKASRIIHGAEEGNRDSWVDIEGYAHLVSETLAEPVI